MVQLLQSMIGKALLAALVALTLTLMIDLSDLL